MKSTISRVQQFILPRLVLFLSLFVMSPVFLLAEDEQFSPSFPQEEYSELFSFIRQFEVEKKISYEDFTALVDLYLMQHEDEHTSRRGLNDLSEEELRARDERLRKLFQEYRDGLKREGTDPEEASWFTTTRMVIGGAVVAVVSGVVWYVYKNSVPDSIALPEMPSSGAGSSSSVASDDSLEEALSSTISRSGRSERVSEIPVIAIDPLNPREVRCVLRGDLNDNPTGSVRYVVSRPQPEYRYKTNEHIIRLYAGVDGSAAGLPYSWENLGGFIDFLFKKSGVSIPDFLNKMNRSVNNFFGRPFVFEIDDKCRKSGIYGMPGKQVLEAIPEIIAAGAPETKAERDAICYEIGEIPLSPFFMELYLLCAEEYDAITVAAFGEDLSFGQYNHEEHGLQVKEQQRIAVELVKGAGGTKKWRAMVRHDNSVTITNYSFTRYSSLAIEAPLPPEISDLVACIEAHPTYHCSSRWPDKLKSKLLEGEWFKLVEVLLATQADVRAGIAGTEPDRPHMIRNIEEYEEHLQPCVYDLARAVFNFIERNTGAEEAPKKLLASILFLMDSCRKWGEREVFESVYSKAVILRKLKME